jgi:hypothetical protein
LSGRQKPGLMPLSSSPSLLIPLLPDEVILHSPPTLLPLVHPFSSYLTLLLPVVPGYKYRNLPEKSSIGTDPTYNKKRKKNKAVPCNGWTKTIFLYVDFIPVSDN